MRNHPIENSEQEVLNKVYDKGSQTLKVLGGEYDGNELQNPISGQVAKKIVQSGDYTYICSAPIGTSQASALWQCKRVYSSGGTVTITWADGDNEFDNVATDPTSLTYS